MSARRDEVSLESAGRHVLVSSDYTVRKPNVLLDETAAARLNVRAADIWFVGDRLDTDVAGAKAAGVTSVWFTPGGGEPSSEVDLTVSGWSDLAARVAASAAVVNGTPEQSY